MRKFYSLFIFLVCCMVAMPTVDAAKHYVFEDFAPVTELNDRQPTDVPEKNDFDLVEYSVSAAGRYPLMRYLDPRRIKRSEDVNSMDQVPSSTWYQPRLGYQKLDVASLLEGPVKKGPPQKPFTIIKAKPGGNSPGFIIKDQRGLKYLIKFDPLDFPNSESTVNLVLNRLFWGFGYNVSEDHLFLFKEEDFEIELKNPEQRDDIDVVLFSATPSNQGFYRTTASLYLEGEVLGPIPQIGTRKGDLNDRIDHENLRVLRALRVFNAWTNNTGMRADNSLDVYEGAPGQGHVVHYMLDFGEAFGAHGLGKAWRWDGFEHIFDFADMTKKALTLGKVNKWERIEGELWDQKRFFEAEAFDPATWKEVTHYEPMRRSLPDDNYWAAKIVAAVSREHIEGLLRATQHPEAEFTAYLVDTLIKRQQKVLDYFFYQVSPLEVQEVQGDRVFIEDQGKRFLKDVGNIEYQVSFYNKKNKKLHEKLLVQESGDVFQVEIGQALANSKDGYLRLEIRVIRDGQKVPRAAEFHFKKTSSGSPKLVGVVH